MSPRRISFSALVITGAMALAGCAAKRVVLTPAPTANVVAANAAQGQADGVTIVARPNAWSGRPFNLADEITPLKVTIRNHSGHPLRIQYGEFWLVGANGQDYAALPPTDIRGAVNAQLAYPDPPRVVPAAYLEPQSRAGASLVRVDDHEEGEGREVIEPDFDFHDYYIAPYWGYGYSGMGWWPYSWSPDMGYYNGYWPYMQRIHLPTRSMLRKAIPEGVIANGGHITGFLYFQKVKGTGSPRPVNLQAQLVDARTGQKFGKIVIPFMERQTR
jgi:hypothetical protein